MRFWLPLTIVPALFHSASALISVNWKMQWCGPDVALFQYGTDAYFTSGVLRWNPSSVPYNTWQTISVCKYGYVAINFIPKSPASGYATFGISTVENNGPGTRIEGCPWKNIGKKGMDPKIPCSSGWRSCEGGYLTDQQLPNFYLGPDCN
jgi:hypothetical protein